MIMYSPASRGFYDTQINSTIPDDAVEITSEEHAALLACVNNGGSIEIDSAGVPQPIADPTPTPAQMLAAAKNAQVETIKVAAATAITAGFTSDALGTAATYGSQQTDQANLLSVVAGAAGGSMWCDETGVAWDFVEHTAPQAAKVLADWQAFRSTQQSKYASLVAQINAATTVAAVQAVTW